MTARRTKLIKESGPYKVVSRADGTFLVTPDWPGYYGGNWGGVLTRMELAREIEEFLNVGTKEGG